MEGMAAPKEPETKMSYGDTYTLKHSLVRSKTVFIHPVQGDAADLSFTTGTPHLTTEVHSTTRSLSELVSKRGASRQMTCAMSWDHRACTFQQTSRDTRLKGHPWSHVTANASV